MAFQTQTKTVRETIEIPIYPKCTVFTEKCERLEPKARNASGFDIYEVEIGKTYLVGCGNMTYKIHVHEQTIRKFGSQGISITELNPGFDIVDIKRMPLVNYCKLLRSSGGSE